MSPRALAWTAAGSAFVLLWAGGLVTSTGSGLAVPDWPLSFGKLLPPMIGGVLFEHGHRLIAGAVALLTVAQTGWALARGERGARRALALAASSLILAQAGLGGATVLLRLPPAVSMAHAVLGQAVFCVLLAYAESLREEPLTLHRAGALAFAAALLQLLLGARLRHAGEGLLWHALWAAGVAFLGLRLAGRGLSRPSPGLSAPSLALAALIPAQVLLGLLAYRWRFSPSFSAGMGPGALLATAHLAAGAAILGAMLLWTLRAPLPERTA